MSRIVYSEEWPGDKGNYHWPVQFDMQDGYLRITQTQDESEISVVLLTSRQASELFAFYDLHTRRIRGAKKGE